MPLALVQRDCVECGKRRPHLKQVPSHALHLIGAVLTAGIWLIVWVVLSSDLSKQPPVCVTCGTERRFHPIPVQSGEPGSSGRAPKAPAE